jgi:hypothetical protein
MNPRQAGPSGRSQDEFPCPACGASPKDDGSERLRRRQRRRRWSYAEAAFWAVQIPPAVALLPEPVLFRYLIVISIYAIVRNCLTGAQADSP